MNARLSPTDPSPLATAEAGDTLDGADLQASIDALMVMAAGLDPLIAAAPDVGAVQALGGAQLALRSRAAALAAAQVTLLAGQARITAAQIDAAAGYALAVVAQVASWKRAVALVGDVVDFFGEVLGGDGAAILASAIALRKRLDAA